MTEALVAVAGHVAPALAGAAVVSGAVALAATRRPALALGVLLDLLLAAGLLRLVGSPGWQTIATAAVVVAVRRLAGSGLRTGARAWTAGRPPSPRRREAARRLLQPAWRR